jgi:hypothetical protein
MRPRAFSSVSNHSKARTLTDELKPEDVERLRAVLKPRRERWDFAHAMNQWAALAYDDEPKQVEDDNQFDDELVNEIIVPGPARRNRGRKLKRTPGQVAQLIKSDFLKNKRRRRERAKIAASTVPTHILKHRKTARSRAGAPRADIRREALVFLVTRHGSLSTNASPWPRRGHAYVPKQRLTAAEA